MDRTFPWKNGLRDAMPVPEPDNRMLLQAASFSVAGETADRLLKDYNRHLVDDLGMMSRREIKKKDIVDLRPVLDIKNIPDWQAPSPGLDFQDKLYTVQDYYYCYIPCFEEGVYHVNAGRYIYWKVTDMDLANHRMMLWLQDFVYYSEGSGWQPGVHGNVAWRFGDPEDEAMGAFAEKRAMKCEYAAIPDAITDYVKMYGLIDVRTLGWPKKDVKAWEDLVVAYARKGCALMKEKTGSHNLDSLAAMFTSYTVKTNRILSEHKAAGKSKPASKEEHEKYLAKKKQAGAPPEKPAKERRVRNIGPISVTSKSRPKPGRRAVADYKKAAWETRGHIRKLKSGKKVWVKKSVHRRKALLGKDTAAAPPETAPVTIRILPQDKNSEEKT